MERDLCRTEAHAPSSAFREGILLQRLRASLVHMPLHTEFQLYHQLILYGLVQMLPSQKRLSISSPKTMEDTPSLVLHYPP